jgi:hypothetical protein
LLDIDYKRLVWIWLHPFSIGYILHWIGSPACRWPLLAVHRVGGRWSSQYPLGNLMPLGPDYHNHVRQTTLWYPMTYPWLACHVRCRMTYCDLLLAGIAICQVICHKTYCDVSCHMTWCVRWGVLWCLTRCHVTCHTLCHATCHATCQATGHGMWHATCHMTYRMTCYQYFIWCVRQHVFQFYKQHVKRCVEGSIMWRDSRHVTWCTM